MLVIRAAHRPESLDAGGTAEPPTADPVLRAKLAEDVHATGDAAPDHVTSERRADMTRPRIAVLSSVFPSAGQPLLGLFVRERMFRVAKHADIVVISPLPWFPGQSILGRFKAAFRPGAPALEVQDGIAVYHPRFVSVPGLLKFLDGPLEAVAAYFCIRRLGGRSRFDLIDAHFVHPDGVAAWLVGRFLSIPYTITLRGQLAWLPKTRLRMALARRAMAGAAMIFTVSASLRRSAIELGAAPGRVRVMANGVNLHRFYPEDRAAARQRLGLSPDDIVLISVGGLSERKGFHRVIEVLPRLVAEHPRLKLLIAGGATAEGDWGPRLRTMTRELGLDDHVRFLGPLPPDELRVAYSSADVFVLATRMEGWANVLLEASACGLPIVTTDVGGNREVVCSDELGTVVPYGDAEALYRALGGSIERRWDRVRIREHAVANSWESRIPMLTAALREAAGVDRAAGLRN